MKLSTVFPVSKRTFVNRGEKCYLIHHPFLNHPHPMRQDLACISRARVIDGHFIFLPSTNNHTNTCHLLADCRPCADLFSLMSFDSSLVLPVVVERMELKKLILWTGVLFVIDCLIE